MFRTVDIRMTIHTEGDEPQFSVRIWRLIDNPSQMQPDAAVTCKTREELQDNLGALALHDINTVTSALGKL